MNAYELADIVDRWAYKESAEYLTDAAKMLRQQADRIRNLEKTLGFKNSGYETINLTPPALYINEKTLREGSQGDTFWDTEVSWDAQEGFVPLYEVNK